MAPAVSLAFVLVGPTAMSAAGRVPGRVVWLAAAVEGQGPGGPSRLRSLFVLPNFLRNRSFYSVFRLRQLTM
ncbi:hypothetical protein F0562_033154 [Nyssa sinensis]|uniref:Uncharacterized protein n=1 Tax=Nyssa sinensis TaxID=561372 RepID=A0A5J5AQL7_9ASTE|nr:hypothetical protein F0562_033154 [Nyssa sinensis]